MTSFWLRQRHCATCCRKASSEKLDHDIWRRGECSHQVPLHNALRQLTWIRLDACSFAYVSATMPSRHISRSGEAHAVWHDTLSLVLCLAGGSMRSSRPIRYSKVWPYVEDTKSRSKVSESEEDLANSGYASPSCFSLCWFAWKADCSASVRQYLWSGRRVAGFWLRQRQTGIHILFATLQIQPDMIEVRSFGSISYILGSVWVDVRELLLRPP